MGVRFECYNAEKTVMRYIIEGDWNWKQFHTCVRISLFTLHNQPPPVDTLIDLRGSTRLRLPAGFAAHVRAFGKKLSPVLSGRAVVIGLPRADEDTLNTGPERTLTNLSGGPVYFVDDEAQLAARLAQMAALNTEGEA